LFLVTIRSGGEGNDESELRVHVEDDGLLDVRTRLSKVMAVWRLKFLRIKLFLILINKERPELFKILGKAIQQPDERACGMRMD